MSLKFVDLFCEGSKEFGIWHDKKGYALIHLNGKDIKLHIHIWEKENGKKSDGYDIHHKDLDKGNYELSNLILLTKSDHSKIHAGWIMTDGEWTHKPCTSCKNILPMSDFYKRMPVPTAKCKKCHNAACLDIYREKMSVTGSANELRNYKKLKAREYRARAKGVA